MVEQWRKVEVKSSSHSSYAGSIARHYLRGVVVGGSLSIMREGLLTLPATSPVELNHHLPAARLFGASTLRGYGSHTLGVPNSAGLILTECSRYASDQATSLRSEV
jgi:hypothetical protein